MSYHLRTKYDAIEATINDGITNSVITATNLTYISSLNIVNDSSPGTGEDLTLKINGTSSPAITVKAGESHHFEDLDVQSIYLTNNSGSNINYRLYLMGD